MYVKYLLNSVAIMATRFLHWVCGRSLTQQPPNGLTIKPWKKKKKNLKKFKKIIKKKKKNLPLYSYRWDMHNINLLIIQFFKIKNFFCRDKGPKLYIGPWILAVDVGWSESDERLSMC